VVAAADGTVQVTGNFRSDAVFGSGEANETTMSSSNWYGQDLFIASYDTDGSLLWARNAQSPWGSFSMDIAAGPGGGTAIAGFFGNEVTFSPGEPDQMSLSAMGELSYPEDFDVFVVRYDANGHLTLAESAGGVISWDEGRGVIITPDDRLLVMGVVSSANFFWPGPSHLILSGPEFIARFSSCSNTEACEGTDDDCDGTIDEECRRGRNCARGGSGSFVRAALGQSAKPLIRATGSTTTVTDGQTRVGKIIAFNKTSNKFTVPRPVPSGTVETRRF
jgi:hypothetical protein